MKPTSFASTTQTPNQVWYDGGGVSLLWSRSRYQIKFGMTEGMGTQTSVFRHPEPRPVILNLIQDLTHKTATHNMYKKYTTKLYTQ